MNLIFYDYSIELPYRWKQTLADVDITVPVPVGTRAKQLVVEIKKNHLTVSLRGQDPIIKVSQSAPSLINRVNSQRKSKWMIPHGL